MAQLNIEPLTLESDILETVETIYEEAFPANERYYTVAELLRGDEKMPKCNAAAAIEGDKVVGFMVYKEKPKFVVGCYFAIDNAMRGKGYGTRIIKAFLDFCGEKVFLIDVETPNPDAPNNEQRIKRIALYERLGLVMTEYTIQHGSDIYTFMINKDDGHIKEYVDEFKKISYRIVNNT